MFVQYCRCVFVPFHTVSGGVVIIAWWCMFLGRLPKRYVSAIKVYYKGGNGELVNLPIADRDNSL